MQSVRPPVNPAVLAWARRNIGYDIPTVARKFSRTFSAETVKSWESGEGRPTWRQLERLSDWYYQPLLAFFEDHPPPNRTWPTDYRSPRGGQARGKLDPQTRRAIIEAEWKQSVASELRVALGEPAPRFPAATRDAPAEELAEAERERLGPDPATVADWVNEQDRTAVYKHWRSVLEGCGILVFRLSFPTDDARGFCLPDRMAPVIVVNSTESVNAQIFTLFHEYAHLLRAQDGICSDLGFRAVPTTSIEREEAVCNRFAGAFLVPRAALASDPTVLRTRASAWTNALLAEVAGRFGVSKEVVLRRLVLIGAEAEGFYHEWRDKQRDIWAEAQSRSKSRGGGPRTHIYKQINRQGLAFPGLVLEALHSERITLSQASEYLGMKTGHLDALGDVLREQQAS